MDFFEILGISKDTYLQEATRQFRKLLESHHPDESDNSERIIQIREAWEQVKDQFPLEPTVYFYQNEKDGLFYRWVSFEGITFGNKYPYLCWVIYRKIPARGYEAFDNYPSNLSEYLPESEKFIKLSGKRKIEMYKPSRQEKTPLLCVKEVNPGEWVVS